MRESRRKRTSAKADAEQIVTAIAEWLGVRGEPRSKWQREPKPDRGGSATATIGGRRNSAAIDYPENILKSARPDLPPPTGRRAGIRVEIEAEGGRRWVSGPALTDDWDGLEKQIADSVDDIGDKYSAEAIYGVSVFVI